MAKPERVYLDNGWSSMGQPEEALWMCREPRCTWSRFLRDPTDYDTCDQGHPVSLRAPAEDGDENFDVRLSGGRTVHLDVFDKASHTRETLERLAQG